MIPRCLWLCLVNLASDVRDVTQISGDINPPPLALNVQHAAQNGYIIPKVGMSTNAREGTGPKH